MAKTAKMRRKRAKKRKAATRARHRAEEGLSPERAARLPVLEVMVSRDWAKHGELAQVLVARGEAGGPVAAATFLVDLCCLGVKNVMSVGMPDESAYRARFRRSVGRVTPMVAADFDLAAKIVREGVGYARSLGFEPHPDYHGARWILHDADPDACREPVPLGGKDGKPLYIEGPHDDPDAVMRRLERRLGRDGFHFLVRAR